MFRFAYRVLSATIVITVLSAAGLICMFDFAKLIRRGSSFPDTEKKNAPHEIVGAVSIFRFLIWRGSLCRDSPSAYIVDTLFPGQKITGQYCSASDNFPGKRSFEHIPPIVLWKIFRISQKSTEDLFSRPKIFSDDILSYIPRQKKRKIFHRRETFFETTKKKLPSYSDESLFRHAYHSNQTPLPHRPL